MSSVIAALTFGGNWIINDKDSIKNLIPIVFKIIKILKTLKINNNWLNFLDFKN